MKWAENVNASDDPMVVKRLGEIEVDDAFNDFADLLIEAADHAEVPMQGIEEIQADVDQPQPRGQQGDKPEREDQQASGGESLGKLHFIM